MITKATPEHITGIVGLLERDADEQRWPAEVDPQTIAHMLTNSVCRVALSDSGEVVGAAAARLVPSYFNAGFWFLAALFVSVHPKHRGNGLGRGLIDSLEKEAAHLGVDLVLQSQPGDSVASDTYKRRGYRPVDTSWARC